MEPSDYPAECSISSEELQRVKDHYLDEDTEFGSRAEGWPPEDGHGNVYPIWFTVDELNEKGYLTDHNGNDYSPFTGICEPVIDGDYDYCNAPLKGYTTRYPEVRYCSQFVPGIEDRYYCSTHKREGIMKSAEELMQTGLFAKTVDHFYEKLDPWRRLVGWGTFESLMGESNYEFAPEPQPRELDFSDSEFQPEAVNEDGILEVEYNYPTDHSNKAMYLFVAAMQSVQMLSVQPEIMAENREEGEGMMESRTIEAAQLTSPTENDPTQQYKTIETWSEHHLNLPFSRLIKDQPRLLDLGGVTTDPEEADDGLDSDDIVLEIQADADGLDTVEGGNDPNAFEGQLSESERIQQSASGE